MIRIPCLSIRVAALAIIAIASANCERSDGQSSSRPPETEDPDDDKGGAGGVSAGGAGGDRGNKGGKGGNAQVERDAGGSSGGAGGSVGGGDGSAGSGGSGGSGGSFADAGADRGAMGSSDTAPVAAGAKLSTDVAPILAMRCALAGCHDPKKKEHGMDLSKPATIITSWVNKMTADHCQNDAAVTRVVPFKPESSFVIKLITATNYCSEIKRMPPPPMATLTPAQIQTIRDWITAGAMND